MNPSALLDAIKNILTTWGGRLIASWVLKAITAYGAVDAATAKSQTEQITMGLVALLGLIIDTWNSKLTHKKALNTPAPGQAEQPVNPQE